MIDKFYKIHRSTAESFRLAMQDILQGISRGVTQNFEQSADVAECYPIRILFFADAKSNEEYLALRLMMLQMCREFFGAEQPLLALVAQSPLRCTLAAEVTYIEKSNAEKLVRHEDYVTIGDEILSAGICSDLAESIDCQADAIFERVGAILAAEGCAVDDITRQWNYIERITALSDSGQHYQLFNDARSRFYSQAEWLNGYPAATGIGTHSGGVVVVFDAVKLSSECSVAVDNPLQISAHAYSQQVLIEGGEEFKSTPKFERARYMATPIPSVYISGTAAIRGEESCEEDAVGQAALTMENIDRLVAVENLLSSGAKCDSTMQYGAMRAYLKHEEDTLRVSEWVAQHYPEVDMLYLLADICREELLIEIEGVVMA